MLFNKEYELLHDAYTGGGGFQDGRYIIRHKREDDEKLAKRKELSYYSNFVRPVVDSLTNPVFRKPILRDWQATARDKVMLEGFIKDIDLKGTPINRFMKKAVRMARLYGVCFMVMDNVEAADVSFSRVVAERKYPYLYIVKPEQVKHFTCDKNGILTSITYEVSTSYSNEYGKTGTVETWTWTSKDWEKKMQHGLVAGADHNLGVVPVIPLFGTEVDEGDILPVSPMLSIAKTNLTIYNLCSELRELLRSQAFAVLIYPVTENIARQGIKDGVSLGPNDMLSCDGEARNLPQFITPSAEQAILIQAEIARLIDDIYRQADLTSVVAVQTKQSGVAKQWDFEQTNQILADMAENCEVAEQFIIYLFCKWINGKIDYKCAYPRDFGIVDVKDEIEKIRAALDLGIGGQFDVEQKIKAAEVTLQNIDSKEYDAVTEDIRQRGEDELRDRILTMDAEGEE